MDQEEKPRDKFYSRFAESTDELAQKIRLHALVMTSRGGGSHIGSCLSVADILAVLYGSVLHVNPQNPYFSGRDRFIMSKGHAGAALYAVLAESGFFSTERLAEHYQDGSYLCGHVSHDGIPGVEFSTGSLGQGLPVACGMALAAKRVGAGHRVFCLMSDGECDEGSVWEAALFAAHHRLDNLTAIIDYNKLQSLGTVADTLGLEPFAGKWRSFGWNVREVDGHSHRELQSGLCANLPGVNQPGVIIAHTVKGKGVSFMENSVLWHYRVARGEEYESALAELQTKRGI